MSLRKSKPPQPSFRRPNSGATAASSSTLPSSSPAFGTPAQPLRPFDPTALLKSAAAGVSSSSAGAILPVILPPPTLRPLAFRIFTKKHGLTLSSPALQELASFVGKHCGAGWKEEGLAEKVLEEVAKSWKGRNGGVIVTSGAGSTGDKSATGASTGTEADMLTEILKTLESSMRHGKLLTPAELNRQNALDKQLAVRIGIRPQPPPRRTDSSSSFGVSRMALSDSRDVVDFENGGSEDDDNDDGLLDPRKWLKIIDAFKQPRFTYNMSKKHFEKDTAKPSLFPPASHKTDMFRNRYNSIHQRLLRNDAFQQSTIATTRQPRPSSKGTRQMTGFKITPISNMLGRHGTQHLLLGLLAFSPTGALAVSDLTGTIALDLSQATTLPHEDCAWFAPGMIILFDGVYEEADEPHGKGLSGNTGVGGTLGGRFQVFFIFQPPCERRAATLGITGPAGGGAHHTIGGGFGWVDFLGVGSERAVGAKMRRLEKRLLRRAGTIARSGATSDVTAVEENSSQVVADDGASRVQRPQQSEPPLETSTAAEEHGRFPGRNRIVVVGELNLDNPRVHQALRKVLSMYAGEPDGRVPVAFLLLGNFSSQPAMARTAGGGSVEYKEYFDELAATLADFPSLITSSTFVLVPGDNDAWASAFGGSAAVPLPRKAVPDVFTSRIRRVVATANAEADKECDGAERTRGEVVFVSNPVRVSLFGPLHEFLVFRDDMTARLSRSSIRLKTMGSSKAGKKNKTRANDSNAEPVNNAANTLVDLDFDQVTGGRDSARNGKYNEDFMLQAQKLVRTVLDQGYLSPFRPQIRPVYWDWASTLHVYPLPTVLVLADTSIPSFAVTYEGCHVINPGSLLVMGRRGVARWAEHTVGGETEIRECMF